MIQRTLYRQSRAAGSSLRTSCTPLRNPLHVEAAPFSRRSPPLPAQPVFLKISQIRSYSTTPRANSPVSSEVPAPDESKEVPPAPPEDPAQKELDAKGKEIIDLKDKYLRSVADFRNLQERTKRDIQSARDFAISRFAKDLIESIDNLDRALSTVPTEALQESADSSDSSPNPPAVISNKDLVNLYSGLKMTEQILMATLQKHGLERFDPSEKGEVFNPNLHEATFQTQVEGKTDGTVFNTQQKGFLLNGRVVRAAKVGVVKNNL